MSGIVCIVRWLGSHQLRPMVEKALADIRSPYHSRSSLVLDEQDICVGNVFSNRAASSRRFRGEIEIIDGVVCFAEETGAIGASEDRRPLTRAVDGRYNALVWSPDEKVLRVSSDIIATKPLYFWTNGNILVLSSELKTFRLFHFINARINHRILAATLVLGHPIDEGSLIDGVEVCPAGHGMSFRAGRMDKFPLDTWRFNSDRYNTPERDLIDELDSVLEASASTWINGRMSPLVSLSGGLDSRTALGYSLRLAPDTVASTWGMPGSDDFLCAARLARAAGCAHRQCVLPADSEFSRSELEQAPWNLECLSAVNLPFYGVPWLRFLAEQGRPVVNGYMADVVAGDVVGLCGITEADFEREAADDAAGRLWESALRSSTLTALADFSTPQFLQHLSLDVADGLRAAYRQFDSEFSYQRLIQMILYHRTRRYIGHMGAPRLCDAATTAVLPFYTRPFLEFYASVPPDQLRNRRLFRQTLLKAFPKMARIREADRSLPPAAGTLLHRTADRIRASYKLRGITGRDRRVGSNAVFDRLHETHRGILADAIGDAHELVAPSLDMRGIAASIRDVSNLPDWDALMRLYNVSVFLRKFFAGA